MNVSSSSDAADLVSDERTSTAGLAVDAAGDGGGSSRRRKNKKRRKESTLAEGENLSEYEQIRLRNIREREKLMEELMGDWTRLGRGRKEDSGGARRGRKAGQPPARKGQGRGHGQRQARRSSARLEVLRRLSMRTDLEARLVAAGPAQRKLKRAAETRTKRRRAAVGAGEGRKEKEDKKEEEERISKRNETERRRRKRSLPNVVRDFSERKVYPSLPSERAAATCCHQCRQKTMDTKTVCRSGSCRGLRGQFCGACLRSRYGQDILAALKDPAWSCPPCLGFCNCSICRTRKGLEPTGELTSLARKKGYPSVRELLEKDKHYNQRG